jgi:uncharacterized protein (TIGR04255 family)
MTLRFPEHEDVVFRKAPLTSVLCQIRFPPILALLDAAGVAGFQEALRHRYPELESEEQMTVALAPTSAELQRPAPIWKLRNPNEQWTVSLAVDFVALDTASYRHFGEFIDRLMEVVAALERTLNPLPSKRIGLRKVNSIGHSQVQAPADWKDLLRSELLGLVGVSELPGFVRSDYAQLHLDDGDNGSLLVRHGVDPDDQNKYRLDLDYWTERAMPIAPDDGLSSMLNSYSASITGFFHWCLTKRLFDALGPEPRSEVAQ